MGSTDLYINEDELKLRVPFGMVISGSSSSGKTSFLLKLLKNRNSMFKPEPKSVLYCFGEYHQDVPKLEAEGIVVCSGPPTTELINDLPKPSLVVLDDLMYSIKEQWLCEMYTKKSHHQNFGIILLCQNLFDKTLKVARLNSQYIVLLRAPNALLSIRNLTSQLFPRQVPFFLDAYRIVIINLKNFSDKLW